MSKSYILFPFNAPCSLLHLTLKSSSERSSPGGTPVPAGEEKKAISKACAREPLSAKECSLLFDDDGRLVKEMKLRKALFEGALEW